MKDWEKALQKFIKPWKARKEVEGIIVTGSRVAGTATKNSDIDIHIILSDKTKWRERGNKRVDGFLMEYFANPTKTIEQYFKNDIERQKKVTARMFALGIILFDKRGEMAKLQNKAQKELKRTFPKRDKEWIETQKYLLWDSLDGLLDLYEENSPGFYYQYRMHINKLLEVYSIYKRAEFLTSIKTYKYFTDPSFAKKYKIASFPDKVFSKYIISCLEAPNGKEKIKRAKKITQYVHNKMGGFNIDGWKLKTPAIGS